MDPLNFGSSGCSIGANGDEVSGANGGPNRHPRHGSNGRHECIHSMMILPSQSPHRVNESFGISMASGANGDSLAPMATVVQKTPLVTMTIH